MGVKADFPMSSQSPAFRRTVARQMEAYRKRLADRIRQERKRRGEGARDIAYAIGISDRQWERWEAGISEPRDSNLKALADYWDIPVEELRPDLEEEERQMREQLDRIESDLAAIKAHLGIVTEPGGDDDFEEVDAELDRQESGQAATDEDATETRRAAGS